MNSTRFFPLLQSDNTMVEIKPMGKSIAINKQGEEIALSFLPNLPSELADTITALLAQNEFLACRAVNRAWRDYFDNWKHSTDFYIKPFNVGIKKNLHGSTFRLFLEEIRQPNQISILFEQRAQVIKTALDQKIHFEEKEMRNEQIAGVLVGLICLCLMTGMGFYLPLLMDKIFGVEDGLYQTPAPFFSAVLFFGITCWLFVFIRDTRINRQIIFELQHYYDLAKNAVGLHVVSEVHDNKEQEMAVEAYGI